MSGGGGRALAAGGDPGARPSDLRSPSHAVGEAAREAYGRLVAYLATRTRDIAAVEDALADAFHAALTTWPADGVPERPEAWLLAAARRRLIDAGRRARVRKEAVPELARALERARTECAEGERHPFPDERLQLLFACAHPAIDAAARTPLLLQAVLGLEAARIGAAFLVSPVAMAQRLTRAKAKIREAGVSFALPSEPAALEARLGCVLEAIYAAYGAARWRAAEGAGVEGDLAEEALALARLAADLMPRHAEAQALAALLLHGEARRPAGRGADGAYVPLEEQDPARWSRALLDEAESRLAAAARAAGLGESHGARDGAEGRAAREAGPPSPLGRFQIEAAIQSAYARRARDGVLDRQAIAALHDALAVVAPSIGALVARAAAIAPVRGAEDGLAALDALAAEDVASYQPFWAVRAQLLSALGRLEEARACYVRAAGLSEDAAVRAWLLARAPPDGR